MLEILFLDFFRYSCLAVFYQDCTVNSGFLTQKLKMNYEIYFGPIFDLNFHNPYNLYAGGGGHLITQTTLLTDPEQN